MYLTGFSRADLLENPKSILEWCERQADKDRVACRGGKHIFFPKSSETDEVAIRDKCGLLGFGKKDSATFCRKMLQ